MMEDGVIEFDTSVGTIPAVGADVLVLIAEDEALFQELYADVLGDFQRKVSGDPNTAFELLIVPGVSAALRALRGSVSPVVLITDWSMDAYTADTLFNAIDQNPAIANKIVAATLSTGNPHPSKEQRVKDFRAKHGLPDEEGDDEPAEERRDMRVMSKPFDIKVLERVVQAGVAHARART